MALAVSWVLGLPDTVSTAEEEVFRFVNEWPDWLEDSSWLVMQLGTIAAVLVFTILVFLIWRRWPVVAGLVVAGFGSWLLAKVVKEFAQRGRPQAFLEDVILRPEWTGLGFVSGHAAVAFGMASKVSPLVRGPWRVLVWVGALATGVLRMYTGAHLPLDIVGGAGLGMALGGLVRLALPDLSAIRHRRRQPEPETA